MKHPGLWIITIIMVLCTLFVITACAQTFITGQMPFDMARITKYTYPTEIAVMLLILAGVMTAADIFCFRLLYTHSNSTRSICNNLCFASWLVGLAIFIYGFASFGGTWAYFLAVTLPPLFAWFVTSPQIQIAGDRW